MKRMSNTESIEKEPESPEYLKQLQRQEHIWCSLCMAMLDERFDYKHERREKLEKMQSDRLAAVQF